MDILYVKIGGFNIKITLTKRHDVEANFAFLRNRVEMDLLVYLRSFLVFEKPKRIDFEIVFVDEPEVKLIRLPKTKTEYTPLLERVSNKKIVTYSLISSYQFERILKNVIFDLLKTNGGFAIHASAASVKGKAYLFLAESGGGKSTTVELLNNKYHILSDDITAIRKLKSRYYVFQTPFVEKAWWIKKKQDLYEVDKIFFLNKSKEFDIVKINDQDRANETVLNQIYAAQEPDERTLKNVLGFVKKFNKYHDLYFDKDSKKLEKVIEKSK